MRGRVGVIFQGRGFESHRRRILQFDFQRKRGRVGSKVFAVEIMKAAVVGATLSILDPEVWGSIPAARRLRFYIFWFLLIFSSLFVVR